MAKGVPARPSAQRRLGVAASPPGRHRRNDGRSTPAAGARSGPGEGPSRGAVAGATLRRRRADGVGNGLRAAGQRAGGRGSGGGRSGLPMRPRRGRGRCRGEVAGRQPPGDAEAANAVGSATATRATEAAKGRRGPGRGDRDRGAAAPRRGGRRVTGALAEMSPARRRRRLHWSSGSWQGCGPGASGPSGWRAGTGRPGGGHRPPR